MALAAVKTFVDGEALTAADLNAMNTNILNNPMSLISPLTASLSAGGFDVTALDELALSDAAAAATAAGRLRRNGSVLEWASANNGGFKVGAVTGTPVANAAYQESFIKGWVKCNAAGTIADSYNVSSITDGGTGLLTVTWNRDFASVNYAIGATALQASTGRFCLVSAQVVGSCQIKAMEVTETVPDPTVALSDPTSYFVFAVGDQ